MGRIINSAHHTESVVDESFRPKDTPRFSLSKREFNPTTFTHRISRVSYSSP